jgi:hypothetical protein
LASPGYDLLDDAIDTFGLPDSGKPRDGEFKGIERVDVSGWAMTGRGKAYGSERLQLKGRCGICREVRTPRLSWQSRAGNGLHPFGRRVLGCFLEWYALTDGTALPRALKTVRRSHR